MHLAEERDRYGDDVLGDGRAVDAARVGDDHGALAQRGEHQVADAGGGALDPPKAARSDELVGLEA